MIIVLSGPPGSGKGTQAEFLKDRLGFVKISTGDLLREHVKNGTEIGRNAKSYMDRGDLVPDAVLLELIKLETDRIDKKKVILLDGYPRTAVQAEGLERLSHQVSVFLNLEVGSDELIRRLSSRRVCGACGWTCHLLDAPPKVVGVCDRCQDQLVQRSDDHIDSIKNRLEVFASKTAPLIDFYKKLKLHVGIKGSDQPDNVYERIIKSLNDLGLEVNKKIV
jgi:adenylate kinase